MRKCPICGARLFDDMSVCYGCLHRFDEEASPSSDSDNAGVLPSFADGDKLAVACGEPSESDDAPTISSCGESGPRIGDDRCGEPLDSGVCPNGNDDADEWLEGYLCGLEDSKEGRCPLAPSDYSTMFDCCEAAALRRCRFELLSSRLSQKAIRQQLAFAHLCPGRCPTAACPLR